jgi:hypothetical protein
MFSEKDIRYIVRDEIRKAFAIDNPSATEFLSTAKAYLSLGYSSRQKLIEDVKNGTFRIGIEVQDRRSPTSSTACYYFNIQACIKRLNVPPEKRNSN